MRVVIIGGGAAGTACARSFVQTVASTHPDLPAECSVTVVDPLEQPVELPPLSKSLAAEELSLVPHMVGENVVRVQATVSEVREAREVSEVHPAEPSARARHIVETTAGELPADAVVYATGRALTGPFTRWSRAPRWGFWAQGSWLWRLRADSLTPDTDHTSTCAATGPCPKSAPS